jgi:hypothetical protein
MSTPETDDLARGNHVVPTEWAQQLEQERDEAREKMADALQEVDLRTLDFERVKQERDQAVEALMKIEDLFIDGTDIYADREKMGTIARNALEETK